MSQATTLYVDLDRTLFDTASFAFSIRKAMKELFAVDITAEDSRKYFTYYDDLYDYDFFRHCRINGVTSEQIHNQVVPRLLDEYGSFLYEDAKTILDLDFDIMTFGSEPYQSLKLKMTPELQDRMITIVHERKGVYIQRELKDVQVTLIDDKPRAMEGYKAGTFIHLDRDQLEPIKTDANGIHINSLAQVKEVLV